MTVQFPSDLAVSDLLEVQVFQLEPWLSRGALAVNPIGVPIDVGSIVDGLVAENVETMLADSLGAADDLVRRLGKQLSQFRTKSRYLFRGEEKSRLHLGGSGNFRSKVGAQFVPHPIDTSRRALPDAVCNLRRAHRAHALKQPFPRYRSRTHSTPRARSSSLYI